MKPEHTKEFSLVDAKAGAPYAQRCGLSARIGIWDAKHDEYPLIGVASYFDQYGESSCTWNKLGAVDNGTKNDSDLVMLPLGYCEGKPVFVGDELVTLDRNYTASGGMRNFGASTWPRTKPVMPNLSMSCFPTFDAAINHARPEIEAYWKALDEFNGVKA